MDRWWGRETGYPGTGGAELMLFPLGG